MVGGGARVGEALSAAIPALEASGVDTPRLDAEVLLSGITGIDRARMISEPDLEMKPADAREFATAIRRRCAREPVAYILGRKGFRYIDLEVDQRVLVPRPETEMLVEVALEIDPASVLEIGTGSGAIALAIADEIPEAGITATDVSASALVIARRNAARLGSLGHIRFVEASLPDSGRFDLIVANLPYVAEDEHLAPEITKYEPRGAVYGGPTGLEVFESVLPQLAASAVEAPVIALEIGKDQAADVGALLRQAGYPEVETRADLSGHDRVVIGRQS